MADRPIPLKYGARQAPAGAYIRAKDGREFLFGPGAGYDAAHVPPPPPTLAETFDEFDRLGRPENGALPVPPQSTPTAAFTRSAAAAALDTAALPVTLPARALRAAGVSGLDAVADLQADEAIQDATWLTTGEEAGDYRRRVAQERAEFPTASMAGAEFGASVGGLGVGGLAERGVALGITKVGERFKGKLYRAAADDYIGDTASFATTKAGARAYQDNPGFGGPNLYRTDIDVDESKVLDLRADSQGEQLDRLVEAAGVNHPGATTADREITQVAVYDALREKGYEWVRLYDTFPEGQESWTYIGGGVEPELQGLTFDDAAGALGVKPTTAVRGEAHEKQKKYSK